MLLTLRTLHVFSAAVGLLAGFMAMLFRKGSGLHGAAGTIFFLSMLSAPGGQTGDLRSDCASVRIVDRHRRRDVGLPGGEQPERLEGWLCLGLLLCLWLDRAALRRLGRSHARARRCFRRETNRSTSVANVPDAVVCPPLLLPRPGVEILHQVVPRHEPSLCSACPDSRSNAFLARSRGGL